MRLQDKTWPCAVVSEPSSLPSPPPLAPHLLRPDHEVGRAGRRVILDDDTAKVGLGALLAQRHALHALGQLADVPPQHLEEGG